MPPPLKKAGSTTTSLSTLGLQRRLLEVAVVVGVDEETGLQQRNLQHCHVNGEKHVLFQMHYTIHLLDIISGTQENASDLSLLQGSSVVNAMDWKQSLRSASSRPRLGGVEKHAQRARSIRKLRKRANKDEVVPVSSDFLSNIPCICLPDDSKVYEDDQKPHIHFAVLTDVNGSRHYAVILRVYQPFYAYKEPDKNNNKVSWKLSRGKPFVQSTEDSIKCYAPMCVCLIARVPYFDVLKTALSCLHKEWKESTSYASFRNTLSKYVTNFSVIPCPPPNLRIRFNLAGWPLTLNPSYEVSRPDAVDDVDLSIPLFIFMQKKQTLLQVLACIMLEQRIVFVSKSYSLVTLVMEALLSFISPFTWPHQYVPLLFSEIIDFVACPGIFLMGCHIMHENEIKQVDNDQILVNLDTGMAFACASYEWKTSSRDPGIKLLDEKLDCHFPPCLVDKTLKRLSELNLRDNSHLNSPSPVTIAELEADRAERKTRNNRAIKNIFLEMMVQLFGNTMHFLDHEINQFRTEEFMETVSAADLPFYIKVVKTYMFKKFVKDRLRRVPDSFSKMAASRQGRPNGADIYSRRTFGKIRSVGEVLLPGANQIAEQRPRSAVLQNIRNSFKLNNSRSKTTVSDSVTCIGIPEGCNPIPSFDLSSAEEEDENVTFNLPSFPVHGTNFNSAHFYQRCIDQITELIKKIPRVDKPSTRRTGLSNSTARASCLIVRGLYLVASGDFVRGLEDLHEVSKEDFRLFPLSVIKTIVASLSSRELQTLQQQTFYKGDEFYETFEGFHRHESFFYSDEDLPCNPLEKSTFTSILEKSDVSSEGLVIDRLFDALSSQSSTESETKQTQASVVDHETFAAFYHIWKQCRYDCEVALRSFLSVGNVNVGLLRDSEKILKVSSVVSSNKGTGRLILTTHKLLFMTELYEECKMMIRLTQLQEMKVGKLKNFLRSSPALVIKQGGELLIRVGLQSESELWMNLISEMKTGRSLSNDWKDHLLTLDTAAQNVAVADALYQAAKDEEILPMNVTMNHVKNLCNFTSMLQSGQVRTLPLETDEMLVLKIDVSPKEAKKSEVEIIMYSTAVIDDIPRVWIALSSSKIRLIDTTKWALDPRPIKDCNSRFLSMCMVGSELWVGATDKSIYVIMYESLKKARVIHEHTAPVVAIFHCGSDVASASSNGEVIVWDLELKKTKFSFKIDPPHNELIYASSMFEDLICCCSKSSVSIYTHQGVRRQLITLNEFFSTRVVDSSITCCVCDHNGEIWIGDSHGSVYVWHRKCHGGATSKTLGERFDRLVPKCTGVLFGVDNKVAATSIMITNAGRTWIGSSEGEIAILNAESLCQERSLKAHDAAVTSLCQVENRYVISGSRSKEGKIAVWRSEQL